MTNEEKMQRVRKSRQKRTVYLTPLEKWEQNKTSKARAVDAMCWQCSHGQKAEIADCRVNSCALWHVRPYKLKVSNG